MPGFSFYSSRPNGTANGKAVIDSQRTVGLVKGHFKLTIINRAVHSSSCLATCKVIPNTSDRCAH